MGKDLKKYLKKFDDEKNKAMLGVELMADLEIESEQLIDFVFLEENFNVNLSTDEKFKLKHIYKSTIKRDKTEIRKGGMTDKEKMQVLQMLDRLDRDQVELNSISTLREWLKNKFGI